MGKTYVNLTCEQLCDLMCGKPEEETMNKTKEEICGYCLHHRKENEEWICQNPDSECYGCYTEYRDGCDSFEDRANSGFSVTIKKKKNS